MNLNPELKTVEEEQDVPHHIKEAAEKRLNQWFDKKFKGKAVCPFCQKSSGTTKKYSDRMLHISTHPEFQKMLDVKRKSMEARATLKEAKERAAAYAKNIKKSQSKEAKNIKS